ncbi:phage holin family protein [Pedobacter arcticus]|uniref:phage holin family protein n=1 Tax=Pedobacter arcticus TaxID=752140 RepID=UPI0003109884|nr:phage holin family protein [Pedobacter arcticus]
MEKADEFNNDGLFERAKDYLDTNIELKKLTIVQAVAKTGGSAASKIILTIVAVFFLFFLSIGAGFYFGELLSSIYKGFFVVTAFYLLVGIIVVLMSKNYIQNPITDWLISKILKKGE